MIAIVVIGMWVLWGITLAGAIYLLGENYLLRRAGKMLLDELDRRQVKIIDVEVAAIARDRFLGDAR